MLPGMRTWWGAETKENTDINKEATETCKADEQSVEVDCIETDEINTTQQQNKPDEDIKRVVNTAKEWGSYFYSVGKKATQSAAQHVTHTAKHLKEQVDEKKVLEKTPILGDFSKEQSDFVERQRSRQQKAQAGVPAWVVGLSPEEEATLKAQIISLSQDERSFIRNPPPGANFAFNFDACFPVAMAMLQEDPDLNEMRYKLVPKKVKEEIFWRNYFYRVSLIKQSAQITSIAFNPEVKGDQKDTDSNQKNSIIPGDTSTESYDRLSDFDEAKGVPSSTPRPHQISESEDFVSDSPDNPTGRDITDLERHALGMTADPLTTEKKQESLDEWEKELQRELNEYELVTGETSPSDPHSADLQDDELEKEIMAQLENE